MFSALLSPNFMPSFGKIVGAEFSLNPKNWQKWPKWHKLAVYVKTARNLKKAAVLCFLHFLPPTSCQVSEKSLERFPSSRVTDTHTHIPTEAILQLPSVFNRGPIKWYHLHMCILFFIIFFINFCIICIVCTPP